jgi:hypothetical protein
LSIQGCQQRGQLGQSALRGGRRPLHLLPSLLSADNYELNLFELGGRELVRSPKAVIHFALQLQGRLRLGLTNEDDENFLLRRSTTLDKIPAETLFVAATRDPAPSQASSIRNWWRIESFFHPAPTRLWQLECNLNLPVVLMKIDPFKTKSKKEGSRRWYSYLC